MPKANSPAARVTEIVELLRPERPRKLPGSLTAAAMDGDLERMQLFLDRGADIEQRSFHASPLAAACTCGQLEAVRWLIAHGAQLDPPGAQISPIQAALGLMNCEIAAVLLDAGLPVENASWGVVSAASTGRMDVLLWLLSRGVELDRTYPRLGDLRKRALAAAEKTGQEEVIRFLSNDLDPGPPPPAPPPARVRPSRPLAETGDRPQLLAEAIELVRANGTKAGRWQATGPSAPTINMSLISHAAGKGVGEIVIALHDAGAALDFPNDGTPPPLHEAAAEAHVDVARILLERGASPDGYDRKTWIPLEAAIMSGEPEVVRLLLDAGARPRAKSSDGRPIADSVCGPYAEEIRNLLDQASASRSGAKAGRKKK